MNDSIALCSGYGQYHTDKTKPYDNISLSEIVAMTESVQSTAKENAQWFIPSTLKSRVHAEQREKGNFYALWLDFDEPVTTLPQTVDIVSNVVLSSLIAYTTKSATQEKQKCRFIIPLAKPCTGDAFVILQKILNDKVVLAGLVPDRATERAGQLCYLPNKGEFYDYVIK